MKRTLCILLSVMLALTGCIGLCVPAAAENDSSPYIAEDFEGTYSIGRCVFDSNGGVQKWESEQGSYDLLTGHYCNGDGSSRGGNESAEIVRVGSGEPVRYGTQSLKLNYDFTGINGIEGASVGFTAQQEIPGNPTGVGLWYYNPEGGRNFWLRIRVLDGSDTLQTLNLTNLKEGVNWFGWKYVECDLSRYQGPFKIPAGETIRVMHTYGAYDGMGNYLAGTVSTLGPDGNSVFLGQDTCKGSVYLDNLQFVYGAYTPEPVPAFGVGDTIRFGSYPQRRVTDDTTLDELEYALKTWKSYGCFSGTGDVYDGQMTAKDYMQYCDVTVNGTEYRGVRFSQYRPYSTGGAFSAIDSIQNKNGYLTDTTYWFCWEPLQWRVLDPDKGLLLCESAIDAQPYQNLLWRSNNKCYQGVDSTVYANDYASSSVREWLNGAFFQAAFTAQQRVLIADTTLDNRANGTEHPIYDSAQTTDKVFLLSSREAANGAYGFSTNQEADDDARTTTGTDYAKCQGLSVEDDTPYIHWLLRSAGYISDTVCAADQCGGVGDFYVTSSTTLGIRPAITVNLGNFVTPYEAGDLIEFGSYPQSRVSNDDSDLISSLNAAAWDTWQPYCYYVGTGDEADGQMMADMGHMEYCDVTVDGQKYRGAWFYEYRPQYTGGALTASKGNQFANGYPAGVPYWFRYEPLQWRVLDSGTGLALCETVIDSQPFNNYILSAGTEANGLPAFWGDADRTHYANNYAESSLRQWLNDDFRNTAFTQAEEKRIVPTTLDNSNSETPYSYYNSVSTTDKVFLLSKKDAVNAAYGFRSDGNDPAKQAKSTDYADCQGINVSADRRTCWRLRSPGVGSNQLCTVDTDGGALFNTKAGDVSVGVRPAITLDLYLLNVPPHVHVYGEPVWDWADDYSSATATFTCTDCGEEQTATDNFIAETVVSTANCTHGLVKKYTASVTLDGTEYTDTTDEVTVPGTTTFHILDDWTEPVPATCGSAGSVGYYTCKTCGTHIGGIDTGFKTLSDDEIVIPATGNHTWEWITDTEPTCGADGVKHEECSVCHAVQNENTPIPATGSHNYSVVQETVGPTCTADGYTIYKCSVCGAVDPTHKDIVDALNHDWKTAWSKDDVNHWHDCTRCDEKNDEAAHTYGEVTYSWEQTRGAWKATAKRACTVCGWEESETVGAAGAQSKAPTCTVNGETTYTAAFGKPAFETQTKTVDDISALDHAYDAVVTPPTCTKDGYTTHTCPRCGDTYVDGETDALGHAFGEWEIIRTATPYETGEKKRTCLRCGEVETAQIEALMITSSFDGQSGSALTVTVPYAKRGAIATQLSAEEPVTYTSSNPKLLTVDEDGSVQFSRLCVFCKSATITAVSADGTKTATCKVNVEVKWWQYIIWFLLGSLWF